MMNDTFSVTGRLSIYKNGELVHDISNLVVTTGKNWVAGRMADTGTPTGHTIPVKMTHMAIGTGTTAEVVANTTLQTEVDRNTCTTAISTNTVTYEATWAAGDPAAATAVTEAGIFTASTGGIMLARKTFPVVNKGTSDAMTITWTITVG